MGMFEGERRGSARSIDSEPNLSEQQAFDLLSSYRRRLALHCLSESGGEATVGELASALAALENEVSTDAVTRKQRKRVYTALRQSHLPRLSEAGVVEYDPEAGLVEATPLADELQRYRAHDPDGTDWRALYLAVLGCSVVGLAASAAGLPLFDGLPWVAWVLALLVGVVSLTIVRLTTGDHASNWPLPGWNG